MVVNLDILIVFQIRSGEILLRYSSWLKVSDMHVNLSHGAGSVTKVENEQPG